MTFTATARMLTRRGALLMALLCLWCSSGATLHHTDDYRAGWTFAAGRSHVAHLAPQAEAAPCAACEWEQMCPTLHGSAPTLWQPLTRRVIFPAALPAALHLRAFDYHDLRGPPLA